MALNKDKNLKLYFSISEVAQMFDVNESTLRFWEKEFDQIRPRKTGKGTRSYRQEEIVNRLKQIKEELLAMKEAFEALEASK